jgi:hypothetical protein
VAQQRCPVDALLAPACGAWLGTSSDASELPQLEQLAGRRFDIVHRWYGVDSPVVPTDADVAATDDGRYLHLNIESRRFQLQGDPAVRWRAIANGRFDEQLAAQGARVAGLDKPVFVTFEHEPDMQNKVGSRGSATDFIAAWRHVQDVYRRAGATNALWVWVVTGFGHNYSAIARLYPGDDAVDWISWDPYDTQGCQTGAPDARQARDFDAVARPFYEWLQTVGIRRGISPDKPYMLSEFASVYNPSDPGSTAAFYRSVVPQLRSLPKIKALQLWTGSAGACDYGVLSHPGVRTTVAGMAGDRYLNVVHPG